MHAWGPGATPRAKRPVITLCGALLHSVHRVTMAHTTLYQCPYCLEALRTDHPSTMTIITLVLKR